MVKLKSIFLLGTAVAITYAVATGTIASPIREVAIRTLAWVTPNQACELDKVLCLKQREEDLREVAKRADAQRFDLLFERDRRAAELRDAEATVADNRTILNEARELYQRCAQTSQTIVWRGARYTTAEFKAQIQGLWEEKSNLESVLEAKRKFVQELEEAFLDNARLRAKVSGELSLMPARIDTARRVILATDFDRVVSHINALAGSADRQIRELNFKLRTTPELLKTEPPKAEPAEPVEPPKARNSDFENFLNGSPRS
jgi:hypothetical protein